MFSQRKLMSEEENIDNERDSLDKSREYENKSLLNENNVKILEQESKKEKQVKKEEKKAEKEDNYQNIIELPSIEVLENIKIPKNFEVFQNNQNSTKFVNITDENFPDPEEFDQNLEERLNEKRRKSEEFKKYLREKYITEEPYLYSDVQNTKESDELLIEEITENERVWKCCSIKCSLQ